MDLRENAEVIVVQIIVTMLALWLLYHLTIWAIPIAAAYGVGWLSLHYGSGWLVAIGMGFLGAVLALGLVHFGMTRRSQAIRIPITILFVGPAVWGGSIAAYSMAIQTGAQGKVWPLVAGAIGGLIFGVMTFARLIGMAGGEAQVARPAAPIRPQAEPFPPPEPKVVYYHPIQPVRPRLDDRRGDTGQIIDL